MGQFQRLFSNRAANAFGGWTCNDSKHLTAVNVESSMRGSSIRVICKITLMSLTIIASVQPTWAQDSSNIAKQAQNPIARLISVPFENDFNPQTGINKENSYVLEMKPVVPFTLSKDWNLITRTIVPVIQVPDLIQPTADQRALGHIVLESLEQVPGYPFATEPVHG